ncbi:protein TRC8 homolog [Schistocerca piceifrons]|uniref:protein TRC8 homolog n=1 Tax=Schistocerca piceifrons TaxID=274613 RepID=UPI001F5EB664|nr:protein TRC8 homolog [Schistocerca piceifrons]XP_049956117.1 protein TRC8 homolog [Schistocerca serialis cubense]
MSMRMRFLSLVDVILRVPPLFVIDELLRIGHGLPIGESNSDNSSFETNGQNVDEIDSFGEDRFYEFLIIAAVKFILSGFGIIAAMCVFMLRTKHLMIVYMYLMSVGIVFVSYWTNVSTMKTVITSMVDESDTSILEDILSLNLTKLFDPNGCGFAVVQNYFIQCLLAFVFTYVHLGPRYSLVQKLIPVSFMAPSVLAVLPVLPPSVLHHAPVFAALLPLAIVKFVLWYSALAVVQTIFSGYQNTRTFINNYGLSALVETEWTRLNVPTVLRTFWILRVWEHASILLVDHLAEDGSSLTAIGALFGMAKSLLISGCETLMAVLGMASVVSYICHYIGCFFQWVLLIEEDDDRSIGTVSAILFYILALQTGLTGLDPEKRFVRLCRNFCLLFTALLHFIHNIVNPLLMSLSASHNPSLHRHVRALLVCAFLILFPISLLTYLWSQHATSTWLFAVSAFSIEVIVKVVVSLLIYSLFLIDAYRSTFWEKLDDYVYYIRASGNAVEFCFGIFLFFNGAWILFFESGGAIRAIMMCVHAYFNIWCEARAGWSVFKKRRTAVNKINSLLEATPEQLVELNDVCAICYQEMKSAKITHCNHFFHGVCLRKWLYVQDRCPLCHNILYQVDTPKDGTDARGIEDNAAPQDPQNVPEVANGVAAQLQARINDIEEDRTLRVPDVRQRQEDLENVPR